MKCHRCIDGSTCQQQWWMCMLGILLKYCPFLHVTEEGIMRTWGLVRTWYWVPKNMVSASLDDDDLQDIGHSPNVLFVPQSLVLELEL